MKKRTVAVLMSCVLAIGMFTGCGNKGTNDTKQTTAEEDQKAADEVAELIDDIYVQERTDETDDQCVAAKEAWDTADRCTERTGRRRKCRSGLFRKRYRRCFERRSAE